eukprot:scaffold4883_cov119-Isochrysis_galbana.AAC.7
MARVNPAVHCRRRALAWPLLLCRRPRSRGRRPPTGSACECATSPPYPPRPVGSRPPSVIGSCERSRMRRRRCVKYTLIRL